MINVNRPPSSINRAPVSVPAPIPSPSPSPSGSKAGQYAGAHADRKSRFEARSDRRRGDWDFGIPTWFLWLGDAYLDAVVEAEEFPEPVVVDLWP